MYGGTFTFESNGGGKSCNKFFRGLCPPQASVRINYGGFEYHDTLVNFQKHCTKAGILNPLQALPGYVAGLVFNNDSFDPSYYCDDQNQYCFPNGEIRPFSSLGLDIKPFINVLANLQILALLSNQQALDESYGNHSGYFPVNSTSTYSM